MGVWKATPRDFYITVAGIRGPFDRCSPVETSSNVRRYRDGGQREADTLADPSEHGDVTVTRAWGLTRPDMQLSKTLRGRVGNWTTTINKQPLKNGVRSGPPIVYTGLLRSVTDGEADSNGGSDPSTLVLVFSVKRIK